MTDCYHTLTVVLEQDIREDDAESLMNAIRQMRKVLNVSGVVSDISSKMAEVRDKNYMRTKLLNIIKDEY